MQTFYLNYFENAWSCPPIMVISPFRKIWWSRCWNQLVGNFSVYLKAKKQSSSLTSFMRYCKDISNLLFSGFSECLSVPIKNHCINLKETFMLIFMQKISFITHFFPEKFQRNRKLVSFVNLGMLSHTHINWYFRFWKCFDVYQQARNPWRLPLDIAKLL